MVEVVKTDRLALSVREARKLLGIGQATIYRAMNEGKIPAVKFGKRTLIPTKGLRDWLDALPKSLTSGTSPGSCTWAAVC